MRRRLVLLNTLVKKGADAARLVKLLPRSAPFWNHPETAPLWDLNQSNAGRHVIRERRHVKALRPADEHGVCLSCALKVQCARLSDVLNPDPERIPAALCTEPDVGALLNDITGEGRPSYLFPSFRLLSRRRSREEDGEQKCKRKPDTHVYVSP